MGYPGLWLELLTTKEPSDDQVEVAILSFEKLLEVEEFGAAALTEETKESTNSISSPLTAQSISNENRHPFSI